MSVHIVSLAGRDPHPKRGLLRLIRRAEPDRYRCAYADVSIRTCRCGMDEKVFIPKLITNIEISGVN